MTHKSVVKVTKNNRLSMDDFKVLVTTNAITEKLITHLFSDQAFFYQNQNPLG